MSDNHIFTEHDSVAFHVHLWAVRLDLRSLSSKSVLFCRSVVWECRYMKNVADVLEGIRHQLPTYAAPVARALSEAVDKAHEKVEKYQNRGRMEAVWKARDESVRHSPQITHHLRDFICACADVAPTVQYGMCP
jgi:hypothetical protein